MKRKQAELTNQLFEAHSQAMYNICLRIMGNKADAEDMLQESFMKAFTNMNKLKDPLRFSGWLKRIVINRCIQEMRSKVFHKDVEDINGHELTDAADDDIQLYSMDQINAAIRDLPDKCRVVFNLYMLEDYKHKEIAEMLNISESTSKSQYQRARKILMKELKSLTPAE